MHVTESVPAKEGWYTPLLRRLTKTERNEDIGLVLDAGNGQPYLAGRRDDILDLKRK